MAMPSATSLRASWFLLSLRLFFEARVCAPTAGFAQGGFPDSQHSLGKCLVAPIPAPAAVASAGIVFVAAGLQGHLPKGRLATGLRRCILQQ